MKPIIKKNGYQSDDDNVRYKINKKYENNCVKSPLKIKTAPIKNDDDDGIRYKFPTVLTKSKLEQKPKHKIKVNFWSNKQTFGRLATDTNKKTNRRHTVADTDTTITKLKNNVKVRKRVSFLPSPLFSDNHVPMVTVPDDLTIQLNEEEANDLGEDLNEEFVNSNNNINKSSNVPKRKSKSLVTQTSPKKAKRKHSSIDDAEPHVIGNENELEFFSKYVVQKLRKMETNQRIYSENLINTVLMLGQLGQLNGKCKIIEA